MKKSKTEAPKTEVAQDTDPEAREAPEPEAPMSEDPTTEPSVHAPKAVESAEEDTSRKHLRGLVEALVFASDQPVRPAEIAKLAEAPTRQVKELLEELKAEYAGRGIQLEEIAGGYAFRTNVAYAPFVRDLVGQKPVKLTRAQLESLAIIAYRQPVTRPEMDDVRGVDCGPVLRTLLERDLVRILGKKDEPGRPILYGTSAGFLELFGLSSLKDLPTLREFTELNEENKRVVEHELGQELEEKQGGAAIEESTHGYPSVGDRPTLESAGNAHSHPPRDEEAVPASQELENAAPTPEDEAADEDDDDDDWDDEDEEWDEDEEDEEEEEEKPKPA